MKSLLELKRETTQFAIEQNPTEITITRTTWSEQNGGKTSSVTTVGPFTVRIFNKLGVVEKTAEAGIKKLRAGLFLLADYQADIRAGANVRDEFEAYGRTFRVVDVLPNYHNGQLTSIQAELEEVQ